MKLDIECKTPSLMTDNLGTEMYWFLYFYPPQSSSTMLIQEVLKLCVELKGRLE